MYIYVLTIDYISLYVYRVLNQQSTLILELCKKMNSFSCARSIEGLTNKILASINIPLQPHFQSPICVWRQNLWIYIYIYVSIYLSEYCTVFAKDFKNGQLWGIKVLTPCSSSLWALLHLRYHSFRLCFHKLHSIDLTYIGAVTSRQLMPVQTAHVCTNNLLISHCLNELILEVGQVGHGWKGRQPDATAQS